jgi:hypothetical protein
LIREIRTYWIMSGHKTCVDWWTRAVIWVIDRGTLNAKYAHRGGMRVKNETGVGKKRPILAYNSLQGPR